MRLLIACASIALILLATPALAGSKGKAGAKNGSADVTKNSSGNHLVDTLITVAERTIIDRYLDRNRNHLPPELAGAKPLPPGIARKIARGGTMPPGIAKRYMPGDLLAQLPIRQGQKWMLAGTDLIIVEIATNVIVDVLKGALHSG
jgi:hypothetical protein